MKSRTLVSVLTTAFAAVSAILTLQQPTRAGDTVFFCAMSPTTNLPTTYALKQSTDKFAKPVIRWYSNYFSSSGYTPWTRCQEVAGRFQKLYDRGLLSNVTTGYVNGLPVVCASSGSGCNSDNLLFTLKQGADAAAAVQKLFNIGSAVAAGSSTRPLYENSADNNPNNNNSINIDMNKFLNNVPSENGVSAPGSPALKPEGSGQPIQKPTVGSPW